MASNFPGPYELEIKYTVSSVEHVHRVSCDTVGTPTVGDLPTAITLQTKDTVGILLNTAVTAYVALLKVRYHTSVTFTSFDFWKYTPLTYIRQWISTGVLSVAGTSTGSTSLAQQSTFTYRTLEGNIMRTVLLESIDDTKDRVPYASAPASVKAIMDYIVASDTWVLARDTSYPISPLNAVGGQNEAVFKARYR